MSTVQTPSDPDENPRIVAGAGGGWLSGAPTSPTSPAPADTRPEFAVAFFAIEIVRLLREHGIEVDLAHRRSVIEIATADLLRACGIRPVSAPPHRS